MLNDRLIENNVNHKLHNRQPPFDVGLTSHVHFMDNIQWKVSTLLNLFFKHYASKKGTIRIYKAYLNNPRQVECVMFLLLSPLA